MPSPSGSLHLWLPMRGPACHIVGPAVSYIYPSTHFSDEGPNWFLCPMPTHPFGFVTISTPCCRQLCPICRQHIPSKLGSALILIPVVHVSQTSISISVDPLQSLDRLNIHVRQSCIVQTLQLFPLSTVYFAPSLPSLPFCSLPLFTFTFTLSSIHLVIYQAYKAR